MQRCKQEICIKHNLNIISIISTLAYQLARKMIKHKNDESCIFENIQKEKICQ